MATTGARPAACQQPRDLHRHLRIARRRIDELAQLRHAAEVVDHAGLGIADHRRTAGAEMRGRDHDRARLRQGLGETLQEIARRGILDDQDRGEPCEM